MDKVLLALRSAFSVCRLRALPEPWPPDGVFFLSRTPDELSLTVETARVPAGCERVEHGFRALRVAGTLDFSLVGVLAELTALLARAGLSVFTVSTYDTDYLFLREASWAAAVAALEDGGWRVLAARERGDGA